MPRALGMGWNGAVVVALVHKGTIGTRLNVNAPIGLSESSMANQVAVNLPKGASCSMALWKMHASFVASDVCGMGGKGAHRLRI